MVLSSIILDEIKANTLTELKITDILTKPDIDELILYIPQCAGLRHLSLTLPTNPDSTAIDHTQVLALFEALKRTSIIEAKINGAPYAVSTGLDVICRVNQLKSKIAPHNAIKFITDSAKAIIAKTLSTLNTLIAEHKPNSLLSPQGVDLQFKNIAEFITNIDTKFTSHIPAFSHEYNEKAVDMMHEGRYQESIELLTTVTPLYQDHHLYNNLASAYCSVEQFPKAASACRSSLHISPNDVGVLKNLGAVLFRTADYKGTREILEQILHIIPNDLNTISVIAQTWAIENNLENAILYYDKAVSIASAMPGSAMLIPSHILGKQALCTSYRKAGKHEEAKKISQEAIGRYQEQKYSFAKTIQAKEESLPKNTLKASSASASKATEIENVKASTRADNTKKPNLFIELTESTIKIIEAAKSGDFQAIESGLTAGANVDAISATDNNTPLHYAAMNGSQKVVERLIEARAKVDALNRAGNTPLQEAARHGHIHASKALLENGASVKAGMLHSAAVSYNIELVTLLLSHGADINAIYDKSSTLDYLAEKLCDTYSMGSISITADKACNMIILLLKHGADATILKDDPSFKLSLYEVLLAKHTNKSVVKLLPLLSKAKDEQVEAGKSFLTSKHYAQAMESYAQAAKISFISEKSLSFTQKVMQHIKSHLSSIASPDDATEAAIAIKAIAEKFLIEKNNLCFENIIDGTEKHLKDTIAVQYANKGLEAYRKTLYKDAISQFQKAATLDEQNPVSHANLSRAYREDKQYDEAVSALEKALDLNPTSHKYHNNLGLIYHEQGDLAKAVSAFQKAIELEPTDPKYSVNLSTCYVKLKDHSNARKVAEESLKIHPLNEGLIQIIRDIEDFQTSELLKNIEDFSNLAQEKMQSGDNIAAIDALIKAIELQPSNPSFYNKLGMNYYELDQYEKAIESYIKAIKIDGTRANYHDNLGSAYYSSGDYKNARDAYQKATLINDKNPEYHFNHGDALLADTTTPENAILAYIAYRKALDTKPGEAKYSEQAKVAKLHICDLQLRNWDLRGRDIGDDDVGYLVEVLETSTKCTILDLRGTKITAKCTSLDRIQGTSITKVMWNHESEIMDTICDSNKAAQLAKIKTLFSEKNIKQDILTAYAHILTDAFFNQLLNTPDLVDAIEDNVFSRHLLLSEVLIKTEHGEEMNLSEIKDRLIAKKLKCNLREKSEQKQKKDAKKYVPEDQDKDLSDTQEGSTKALSSLTRSDEDIIKKHLYGFDIIQNLVHISNPRAILELFKWIDLAKTPMSEMTITNHPLNLCYGLLNVGITQDTHNNYHLNLLFERLSSDLEAEQRIELGYRCIEFKMYKLAIIALKGVNHNVDAEYYSNLGKAYDAIGEYTNACNAFEKAIALLTPSGYLSKKGARAPVTPPLMSKVSKLQFDDEVKIWDDVDPVRALNDIDLEALGASTPIHPKLPLKPTNNMKLAECHFNLGRACAKIEASSAIQHYINACTLDNSNAEYQHALKQLKQKMSKGDVTKVSPTSSKSDLSTSYSSEDEAQLTSPARCAKKATSAYADNVINLSAKWTINNKTYSCDNKIVKVEGLNNFYAAIDNSCIDRLDGITVNRFKASLSKFARREEGQNGVKFLKSHKGYELKINEDDRLFCNVIYKNEDDESLLIFTSSEDHGSLSKLAQSSTLSERQCPYNDPDLEIFDLSTIIGDIATADL